MTVAKEPKPESMNIIQLITKIKDEVGALEKTKESGGVPFPFRGIDSTINHLSAALIKYGVVTVPTVEEHMVSSREAGNRVVKTTEVMTRFRFYAPDMTYVDSTTAGLADDFGDRSTAQAQSVAYRIALLQTFSLPTQSPEPEVTGQTVMDHASAPAKDTRAGASIKKATARPSTPAASGDDEVGNLRLAAKQAAGAKGLTSSQLNEMGVAISADFFTEVDSLKKLVAEIEAIAK